MIRAIFECRQVVYHRRGARSIYLAQVHTNARPAAAQIAADIMITDQSGDDVRPGDRFVVQVLRDPDQTPA